MTERLYYEDVYIKESYSRIIEVGEYKDTYTVVLDKTPFYPEGGGQPSDTGYIGEARVSHVYEREGKVYHVVDKVPQSEEVHCIIDYDKRFDRMQQHSGEHILAACFNKCFGTMSSSFHLGDDYISIDISMPEISAEEITKIEDMANGYIYENLPVHTFMVTPEESKNIKLRKNIEGEEKVRVVQIEKVDACACCGTHVKNTGEIGIIKIIKSEKYKGLTRVYFKCGKRAFDDFRAKQDIVTTLVRNFSTGEGELINKINNDQEHMRELGRKLSDYKKKCCSYEARELKELSRNNIIYYIYDDKEMEELQMLTEQLSETKQFIILGSARQGQVIVSAGGGYHLNIGQFFKEKIKEFNGRGGGKADRAQGSFTSELDLRHFTEELIKHLE
ncbi:alanyl-tRNA editing protein [Clostridium thermarum]|uniref:alanyl-tRNA editing protein n=1 Tax=Clostridium thermarum TaxID=1716543 RepID=UPI0013D2A1FC|nr:alanine--tRNA ligase-related protein [Clostridium thermarum]